MTCKKCKLNISAMLDGCLNEEVCRQVESHMISCDECKKYYKTLITMRGTLGNQKPRSLPEGFENKLHFALEREAAQPKKNTLMKRMPMIAAAAASILLIAGAVSFTQGFGGMKSTKNAADSAPREFLAMESAEDEAADGYTGSGEAEAPMQGIMSMPEAAEDMALENEYQFVRTVYQVGVTTADDDALFDSLNALSLQNSGSLRSSTAEPRPLPKGQDNAVAIDMPAGNYDSFILGLSSHYALDYVNAEAQDLSDEVYDLQQREMYLNQSIGELLSIRRRSAEQDAELEALEDELRETTARLNELYWLSSNVQVNIVINSKE